MFLHVSVVPSFLMLCLTPLRKDVIVYSVTPLLTDNGLSLGFGYHNKAAMNIFEHIFLVRKNHNF